MENTILYGNRKVYLKACDSLVKLHRIQLRFFRQKKAIKEGNLSLSTIFICLPILGVEWPSVKTTRAPLGWIAPNQYCPVRHTIFTPRAWCMNMYKYCLMFSERISVWFKFHLLLISGLICFHLWKIWKNVLKFSFFLVNLKKIQRSSCNVHGQWWININN